MEARTRSKLTLTLLLAFALALPLVLTGAHTTFAEHSTINLSNFDDSYWYYGRTESEFFDASLDMDATASWNYAQAAIGYSAAGGRETDGTVWNGALATTIPSGAGDADDASDGTAEDAVDDADDTAEDAVDDVDDTADDTAKDTADDAAADAADGATDGDTADDATADAADGAADPVPTLDVSCLTLAPGSDETQLTFSWHTADRAKNDAPVVRIWKDGGAAYKFTGVGSAATPAISAMHCNKATVTGLEPDAVYMYQLGDGNGSLSAVYTTKTGAEGDFQFIAVGDPQLSTGNQDSDSVWPDPATATKEGWQDTLNKISRHAPNARFIAGTGDQIDTAANEAQYANYFAPGQLRSLPVAPAVGNHEGSASNFGWHFAVPNETDHSGKPDAFGNYWYAYNNALFVALNTAPYPASAAEAAPYIEIMDATLKAATDANPNAQWLFVQHHKSTTSPASHQDDADVLVWAPLFNSLMDKYHVDFVLAGHDHVYSRSWAIKDGQIADADYAGNAITNPKGTLYFTLNTASGLKYYDFPVNAPAAPAWVGDTSNMYTERKSGPNDITGKPWYTNVGIQIKAPQFTTVDVAGSSVTFKTYRTDTMAVIDECTVIKTNSPTYNPGEIP